MTIIELIKILQNCNWANEVKIFNIERNMDILEVDINPERFDSEKCEEIPIPEIWLMIGFEGDNRKK